MPIDTSPEGAELLHKPVVWPFPQSTDSTSKPHTPEEPNDDGHNHEGEARDAEAEEKTVSRGLRTGRLMSRPWPNRRSEIETIPAFRSFLTH
jgi:hypothetical protein